MVDPVHALTPLPTYTGRTLPLELMPDSQEHAVPVYIDFAPPLWIGTVDMSLPAGVLRSTICKDGIGELLPEGANTNQLALFYLVRYCSHWL